MRGRRTQLVSPGTESDWGIELPRTCKHRGTPRTDRGDGTGGPGLESALSVRVDIHRDGMLLVGFLCGVAQVTGRLPVPIDALAYWNAGTSSNPYPEHWGSPRAGQWLYYPPPVVQLSRLLQPLGPELFTILLTVAIFGAMWYCARRWSWVLLGVGIASMVGALPSWGSVFLAYALLGNVQWILAALTIAALKRPWLWSLQVVSKMTSAIGWWWHPLRGEWRAALEGAVVTVAIVAFHCDLAGAVGPIRRVHRVQLRSGQSTDGGLRGAAGDPPPRRGGAAGLGSADRPTWSSRSAADWRCRLVGHRVRAFLIAATRLVSPPKVPVPWRWSRPLRLAMIRTDEPEVLVAATLAGATGSGSF